MSDNDGWEIERIGDVKITFANGETATYELSFDGEWTDTQSGRPNLVMFAEATLSMVSEDSCETAEDAEAQESFPFSTPETTG